LRFTPAILVGIIAAAVALVAGCGLSGYLGYLYAIKERPPAEELAPTASAPASAKGAAGDAAAGVANVGAWSRVGDVRMKIDRVALQKPVFVDQDFRGKEIEREGKEVVLVVWYSVENLSKTKRMEYARWDGIGTFGGPAVKLTDEHENSYTYHPPHGIGGFLKGGLEFGSKVVNPGEAGLTDAVTFDRLVSAATVLKLSARSPVIGAGKDRHEFRITAAAWK
jgi:hypothetical protein